jgi:hypothetical protein
MWGNYSVFSAGLKALCCILALCSILTLSFH